MAARLHPLALLFLGSSALSCTEQEQPKTTSTPVGAEGADRRSQPQLLDAERTMAAATAALGLEIHRAQARIEPLEDSLIAPYSLAPIVALLASGARGATAVELVEVLHLPPGARVGGTSEPRFDEELVHGGLAALSYRVEFVDETAAEDVWRRIRILEDARDEVHAYFESAAPSASTAEGASDERESEPGDIVVGVYDFEDEAEHEAMRARDIELSGFLEKVVQELPGHTLRTSREVLVRDDAGIAPDFERLLVEYANEGPLPPGDDSMEAGPAAADAGRDPSSLNHSISQELDTETFEPLLLALNDSVEFIAGWAEEFEDWMTDPAPFTPIEGPPRQVQMMWGRMEDVARYAAFEADGSAFATPRSYWSDEEPPSGVPGPGGVQVVELPYRGLQLSFLLVVPVDVQGLVAVEEALDSQRLAHWIAGLEDRAVDVELPRFEVANTVDVADLLRSMGVRRVFSHPRRPGGADLSRGFPDEPLGAFVDEFTQAASIEVDERGTVVEVDTELFMRRGGRASLNRRQIPFVPEIVADRPFLFMIIDRATGTPLFIGRKVTAD